MKLKEIDIRTAVEDDIRKHFDDDEPRIIHELGLCRGKVIIDIAAVNGFLHGFEIKSEGDTLERLPRQAEVYSRVFDTLTLVVSSRHLDHAGEMIPEWWGIVEVVGTPESGVELGMVRESRVNTEVDPISLAQLLWRDEVLELLETLGLAQGYRSKSSAALWARLASSITLAELQGYVRATLKSRAGWRSDLPLA